MAISGRLEHVVFLIVDDDEDVLPLLEEVLGKLGALVVTASRGAEAIQIVNYTPPDVLISDITMPEMDGIALISEIREKERKKGIREGSPGFLPAIAVTALTTARDIRESVSAGFQIHLAKPVNISELVSRLEMLAGRR